MHAGMRVGHYEVLAPIGRGGMGEVWKARDTKLKREVALKTLPLELARNPDRLARLEREAELLAALNHPNIATIHGIEEQDGKRFLALELVDGATLADRLCTGPIAVKQAIDFALQIAAALEAAHEKGVIHRDLKPANIKITPDGRVKVLDFGLAKALGPLAANAATQTAVGTELGTVTGTAPYMSPEQARGEAAGPQSDIWSFGVVLFEMLTGISPFIRDTGTETLARVLEADADFAALPAAVPPAVRRLVRRCLEKDVRRRFRHVGDVRIELEDALAAEPAAPAAAPRGSGMRRSAVAATLVAAAALFGIGLGAVIWRGAPNQDVVRLSIAALELPGFSPVGARHIALSPDGSRFAYAGRTKLLIRRLGEDGAIEIEPPATLHSSPFFSPDGEWLGFFDGAFKKVPSAGGTPVRIVETTERPAGATWGADGTIVFATTSGLYAVAAEGGEPRMLLRPNAERGEREYVSPGFVADSRLVLFTVLPIGSLDGAQIAWLDVETLETGTVLTGGTSPHYARTGHLLYVAGQTLTAVRFDPTQRALLGDPVPLRNVAIATAPDNGAAEYTISDTGRLAYIAPSVPPAPAPRVLVWTDRAGNDEPLGLAPGDYVYPRVSPDGTSIALDLRNNANRDIWIWDSERETLSRLTDGPNEDMTPVWSPDGRRVFFSSARGGNFDVYSQPVDGSASAKLELADPRFQAPVSFSPDGARLILTEEFSDLSVLDLTNGERQPLLQREAIDFLGELSPDGKWLAYETNESGSQFEIYLRPFPDVEGRREKVSIDGGRYAQWGPSGSGELYYVDLQGALMAVPIELEPTLRIGRPVKLFDMMGPGPGGTSARVYDVSPVDGRFLRLQDTAPAAASAIHVSVVLNWFTELREQTAAR